MSTLNHKPFENMMPFNSCGSISTSDETPPLPPSPALNVYIWCRWFNCKPNRRADVITSREKKSSLWPYVTLPYNRVNPQPPPLCVEVRVGAPGSHVLNSLPFLLELGPSDPITSILLPKFTSTTRLQAFRNDVSFVSSAHTPILQFLTQHAMLILSHFTLSWTANLHVV